MTILKKLLMLIESKKSGVNGISKRQLAKLTGVVPTVFRNGELYTSKKELQGLPGDERVGFKPSLITKEEHKEIEATLNQPENALRGYKELMQWIKEELGKELKYTTVVEYAKGHFKSKIKVMRKSHVLKNEALVSAFKKTSAKPFRK